MARKMNILYIEWYEVENQSENWHIKKAKDEANAGRYISTINF